MSSFPRCSTIIKNIAEIKIYFLQVKRGGLRKKIMAKFCIFSFRFYIHFEAKFGYDRFTETPLFTCRKLILISAIFFMIVLHRGNDDNKYRNIIFLCFLGPPDLASNENMPGQTSMCSRVNNEAKERLGVK